MSAGASSSPPGRVTLQVARQFMGTEFTWRLYGEDPDVLSEVAEAAFDEVERLDAQLSHYRNDSDISDLNLWACYRPVRLEPGLYEILRNAADWSERTRGAFDCTCGALIRAWGFFRGSGCFPSPEQVEESLARCGWRNLRFDDEARTVEFTPSPVELNLGALGKGIAIDAAAAVMRACGVKSALLDSGSSTIYALGSPRGEPGWDVGIRHPRRPEERILAVRLRDEALSTSANTEQTFEHEGVRYGHLLDPRTGRPAAGVLGCSVVAPTGFVSEVLSTAGFVLSRESYEEVMLESMDRGVVAGAILIPVGTAGADPDVIRIGRIHEAGAF